MTSTTATGLSGQHNDSSSDKLIPTYPDGSPIKWPAGSNPAHLKGILHELARFYTRHGLFVPLFENNAVTVGTKLAVDSVAAVKFITGMAADTEARSFASPCPSTEARIREFNARATAGGRSRSPE